MLESYHPTTADDYGDGCSLAGEERRIVTDIRSIDRAKTLINGGEYEAAIKCLDGPVARAPLPAALTLRASAYQKINE